MAAGSLEPLASAVLRRRLIDVFPAGYLTFIAIIQGAAFGILVIDALQQVAICVAVIVIATHRYLVLSVLRRWTPTVFDVLLAYLAGFGEISSALTIGHRVSWWAAVASFFAAAMVAFSHTVIRTLWADFGEVQGRLPGRNYSMAVAAQAAWCGAFSLFCVTAAVLDAHQAGPAWRDLALACALAGRA